MPAKRDVIGGHIKQRNSAIKSMARIGDKISALADTVTAVELQCQLEILEGYFRDVQEHQRAIEELDYEPEWSIAEATREEFESLYCKVKSSILVLISAKSSLQTADSARRARKLNTTENLPKLKLPQFSGKYAEYQNFIHLFTTLVDNNESLTDIEKYNHLLSCLSGAALRTVKALDLIEGNYSTALTLLKSRYDNKFLMCQEHIKDLFNMPKVPKGSSEGLRTMVDTVSAHFNALSALISYEEMANALVVYLALGSVDADTQFKVQESINYNEPFNWSECANILNKYCQTLETRSCKLHASGPPQQQLLHGKVERKAQRTSLTAVGSTCSLCNKNDHHIWKCSKFLELQPMQRFDAVKRLSLCINCFSKQHTVRQCKASLCKQCNEAHHTLLHRNNNSSSANNQNQQQLSLQQQQQLQPSSVSYSPVSTGNNELSKTTLVSQHRSTIDNSQHQNVNKIHTMLATAVVEVTDRHGNQHPARALLDSASQSNFMTQRLANVLKVDKLKTNTLIGGIGENEICAKFSTTAVISSRHTEFKKALNFVILPKITGAQPHRKISIKSWDIPQHVDLADEQFNIPQPIDLLIGAEMFFQLLRGNQINISNDCPTLFETELGWIMSGNCSTLSSSKAAFTATTKENPDIGLEELVQKFWEVEAAPASTRKWSKEQTLCEEHFVQHVKRLESGRFMVKLPFKQPPSILGKSQEVALRRFLNQEKRLRSNPQQKAAYGEFLNKYEEDGHMQVTEWPPSTSGCYFLPHHCVIRPDKTTTKCRVVFDASAKSSNNLSLNDILMVGPVVQNELFEILLRFRLHAYGLMADITAMYRQILVYPENQNVQHIIWRNNERDDLKIYKLKTVTYGTASAPYLATRCLTQLAEENLLLNPTAATIVKNDFYVDDLITGGSTLEEIRNIKSQVSDITMQGQFQLRKWYSNHQEFLESIPPDEREKTIKLNNTNVVKALGIIWDASSDSFKFSYTPSNTDARNLTKRMVLSELAKLFDPLGLIKPVITKAKIFMQELWIKKLGWDEIVPKEQANLWVEFVTQLSLLNEIKVSRFVLLPNCTIELHGFGDASSRAYGCCFYIRCTDAHDNSKVSLYTAKSKVAPIGTVRSIPCLELCAAHLMVQLLEKVEKMVDFNAIYLWSDNITVLSWLAEHASNFNTFVANRVAYIQEHAATVSWRYVPTKLNPADVVSRGATVQELNSSIWFSGPSFLQTSSDAWPKFPKQCLVEELPERKIVKTVLVTTQPESFLETIHTTNNFMQTCKRMAYIRRFIKNCRDPEHRAAISSKELSAAELDEAFIQMVFIIQRRCYVAEIKQLQSNKQVIPSSTLKDLNPFIEDVHGLPILKVGGRLKNADLPYEARCPMILPKTNAFVGSYVQHLHLSTFHSGAQALVGKIRERCWIIGARDYARKVIKNCVHCFKYRPRMLSQIMGNLPKDRVTPAKPFANCGVDFCGPIITTWRIRGKPRYKSYISVFVCFVTRAVHLEVVSDLTADAFLAALKRFIGRRGMCSTLYLDNATNFVGARNKLQEFKTAFFAENMHKAVSAWCSTHNIDFKHIPPRSPHFGVLWEAAVKSAKHLLYKTMKSAVLTYEELSTVAAQIEGILNSRPLSALTNDPSDEEVLTPAHFLNQTCNGCIVEPTHSFTKVHCLKVWQQITALQQHFWARWSKEYISSLQNRHKWVADSPNVKVGSLVLIHEDNLPPQRWVLGRIVNVMPGQDGKVRVADVKTRNGVIRRAITKLAALPIEQ